MSQNTKAACNTLVDDSLLAEVNALSQDKADLWRAQNADAIAAYNQQIAEHGTFAEQLGQI